MQSREWNFCGKFQCLRFIHTYRSGLQILKWTCANTEILNFLFLQKRSCLPQSSAENACIVNEPLQWIPSTFGLMVRTIQVSAEIFLLKFSHLIGANRLRKSQIATVNSSLERFRKTWPLTFKLDSNSSLHKLFGKKQTQRRRQKINFSRQISCCHSSNLFLVVS